MLFNALKILPNNPRLGNVGNSKVSINITLAKDDLKFALKVSFATGDKWPSYILLI